MSDPFDRIRQGLRDRACETCGLNEVRFAPGIRKCPKAAQFALGAMEVTVDEWAAKKIEDGAKVPPDFILGEVVQISFEYKYKDQLFRAAEVVIGIRVEECADRRIRSAIESGVYGTPLRFQPTTTFDGDEVVALIAQAGLADFN